MNISNLLSVNNLQINFGAVTVVKGISLDLAPGSTLGIVGESGSGKSLTALAIMGLLPDAARQVSGEILFKNKKGETLDLCQCTAEQFAQLRGKEIAMIFQEPMSALNPVMRCGEQVSEAMRLHLGLGQEEAKKATLTMFNKAKLPDPERVWGSYPHQLSGGQRQRVMIALALSCNPTLLIADEPTSALDVTVQKAILNTLQALKSDWGGAMLFISHDLSVISQIAENVLVMQNGEIVEAGKTKDVFENPFHFFSKQLVGNHWLRKGDSSYLSVDSLPHAQATPLLQVERLSLSFKGRGGLFQKKKPGHKAVDEVSLEVRQGETLGIVGESGSGKTTLGRSILQLLQADSGQVLFKGKTLRQQSKEEWKPLRRQMQIVFQDPNAALNPRMSAGDALMEPMRVYGMHKDEPERRQKALELLESVGLEQQHFERYPHEFSGGQRQRLCIARAMSMEPELLICDECLSALDVTVQMQVIDLLRVLKKERNLTYLFISHDLTVVRLICERVAVMKDGKIVEQGSTEQIFSQPKTEYTRQLIEAIPRMSF